MTIEQEADKDVALDNVDAEQVGGGRMTSKKHPPARPKHADSAATAILVNASPIQPSGNPGIQPGMSQAELDADPDC